MLITPEYVFQDVTHITPEWLAEKGIRALVLDIDNTLTADRSQELPDEVAQWLADLRTADIGLTIVSNGAEKRVRPFAEKLGLAYLYRSAKPLPFALMAARPAWASNAVRWRWWATSSMPTGWPQPSTASPA